MLFLTVAAVALTGSKIEPLAHIDYLTGPARVLLEAGNQLLNALKTCLVILMCERGRDVRQTGLELFPECAHFGITSGFSLQLDVS